MFGTLNGDDIARLAYLGILLAALLGYGAVSMRRPGRTLRHLSLWALIFVGVIAARGLWQDIRQDVVPRQAVFDAGARIEVPVSDDGHYYVTLALNGVPVRFVVDTGASDMVLSARDAARVGIDTRQLAFVGQAQTANGRVATAPVRIETVALGEITDRGVRASVNDGQMSESLLGMSYLSRFASLEIRGDRLILTR